MGQAIDSLIRYRQLTHSGFTGTEAGDPSPGQQILDGNQFNGATGLLNVDWTAGTTLEIQVWVYDGLLDKWCKLMLIDATILPSVDSYALKVDVAGQTWGVTVPTNDGTVSISAATVARAIGGS